MPKIGIFDHCEKKANIGKCTFRVVLKNDDLQLEYINRVLHTIQ